MIKVLIVEDVPEMAELLKTAVESVPNIRVSALAASVLEARVVVAKHRPDLVLLDEILLGESVVDWLADLVQDGIPVILVTGVQDPTHPLPEGVLDRWVKPDWKQWPEWAQKYGPKLKAAVGSK